MATCLWMVYCVIIQLIVIPALGNMGVNNYHYLYGEDRTIFCDRTNWTYQPDDGKPINLNNGYNGLRVDGREVIFKPVNSSHEGLYWCNGDNKKFNITVYGLALFNGCTTEQRKSCDLQTTYMRGQGETLQINVSFHYIGSGNRNINEAVHSVTQPPKFSKTKQNDHNWEISIHNLSLDDSGTYSLSASFLKDTVLDSATSTFTLSVISTTVVPVQTLTTIHMTSAITTSADSSIQVQPEIQANSTSSYVPTRTMSLTSAPVSSTHPVYSFTVTTSLTVGPVNESAVGVTQEQVAIYSVIGSVIAILILIFIISIGLLWFTKRHRFSNETGDQTANTKSWFSGMKKSEELFNADLKDSLRLKSMIPVAQEDNISSSLQRSTNDTCRNSNLLPNKYNSEKFNI